MASHKYEVVVAGSGVGGICSAALLAHHGYQVLLVEALERLGGRWSTIEKEGFKIPTGAVALPNREGPLFETFKTVGAPFDVREIGPPAIWIEGQWHILPEKGQIKAMLTILDKIGADKAKLMGVMAREAVTEKVASAFRRDRERVDPGKLVSVRDWLKQYTDDERVFQVFHAVTSSLTTVNDFEYPVSHFFRFLSSGGQGGLHYVGVAPRGNVELANALAKVIKAKGGEVWTGSAVEKIIIQKGKVTGLLIQKEGKQIEVGVGVLISDIGPKETIKLTDRSNFSADFLEQVDGLMAVPIVHILVASDKPLTPVKGVAMVAGVKRVVNSMPLTPFCPELAPPGQHLLVVWGTPASSKEHINKEEEIRANIDDIRTVYPDFDQHGRIIHMEARDIDDYFPALRSWMGYDLPQETPLLNLFFVGDAVKPFGWEGTPSCAQSAKLVVNMARKRFRPGNIL